MVRSRNSYYPENQEGVSGVASSLLMDNREEVEKSQISPIGLNTALQDLPVWEYAGTKTLAIKIVNSRNKYKHFYDVQIKSKFSPTLWILWESIDIFFLNPETCRFCKRIKTTGAKRPKSFSVYTYELSCNFQMKAFIVKLSKSLTSSYG